MSDHNNKVDPNRRDFLRGGFIRRALEDARDTLPPAPVRPAPPVHTISPAEALTPEQTVELARARARAMIGVVQPPTDQKPFDIFSLLTSFDRNPELDSHRPQPDADQPVVAHINTARCLAHTGSFCTVCSEHCPADGAIQLHNNLPQIDPLACTGCAQCYRVCPAPVIAITLSPLDPPSPPTSQAPHD